MPGFDSTGPMGKGSRTGRGLGKCNPKNEVTEDNIAMNEFRGRRRPGRGLANRLGRKRG